MSRVESMHDDRASADDVRAAARRVLDNRAKMFSHSAKELRMPSNGRSADVTFATSKVASAERLSKYAWPASPAPALPVPDPRYRLDNLVAHGGNYMAHAAIRCAAGHKPGAVTQFNPIFLHGGSGLGKTHLLNAAVTAALGNNGRAFYVQAGVDVATLKESLFGHPYDLAAIDDVHLLRQPAQRRLAEVIDKAMAAGRQIILAASVLPGDVRFDERLRVRTGLVVALEPPNEAGRTEILRAALTARAARGQRAFVTAVGDDIVAAIAANGPADGWMLDKILDRLRAAHSFEAVTPTVEQAMKIIAGLRPSEERAVRIEDILRVTAHHFGISRVDLLSPRRTANVVLPRQIAMFLAKTLTPRSLPEIGRRFGGRDHTTVLHAVRKVAALVETDANVAADIAAIKAELGVAS